MKKMIKGMLVMLLAMVLLTGCGNSKTNNSGNANGNDAANGGESHEQTVIEDQVFEGLEFVNVGASNGIVKTVVINNTGVKYEGSKFSMKIIDASGNVLVELIDEVKEPMENGTTKTIETKTNADLTKAAAIEYSIISK